MEIDTGMVFAVGVLFFEFVLAVIFWKIYSAIDKSNKNHEESTTKILHEFQLQNQARENTVKLIEKISDKIDVAAQDHIKMLTKLNGDK